MSIRNQIHKDHERKFVVFDADNFFSKHKGKKLFSLAVKKDGVSIYTITGDNLTLDDECFLLLQDLKKKKAEEVLISEKELKRNRLEWFDWEKAVQGLRNLGLLENFERHCLEKERIRKSVENFFNGRKPREWYEKRWFKKEKLLKLNQFFLNGKTNFDFGFWRVPEGKRMVYSAQKKDDLEGIKIISLTLKKVTKLRLKFVEELYEKGTDVRNFSKVIGWGYQNLNGLASLRFLPQKEDYGALRKGLEKFGIDGSEYEYEKLKPFFKSLVPPRSKKKKIKEVSLEHLEMSIPSHEEAVLEAIDFEKLMAESQEKEKHFETMVEHFLCEETLSEIGEKNGISKERARQKVEETVNNIAHRYRRFYSDGRGFESEAQKKHFLDIEKLRENEFNRMPDVYEGDVCGTETSMIIPSPSEEIIDELEAEVKKGIWESEEKRTNLSDEQILEIVKKYKKSVVTYSMLSEEYGVTVPYIAGILRGRNRSKVTGIKHFVKKPKTLTYQGETKTVTEWAVEMDMSFNTLESRIMRGWSVEMALTFPVAKKHLTRRMK